MTQNQTPTTDDVVSALGASERFPVGTPQYDAFAPHIGSLLELAGEEHLDDQVGMGNLCVLIATFLRTLVDNDEFMVDSPDERDLLCGLYGMLADQLELVGQDPQLMLRQMGVSESEALQMDSLGLAESAKQLVRDGELTMEKLISSWPDVFIPRT